MDQTLRYMDRPLARPELRHHLSVADLPGCFRVRVRPQEYAAAAQALFHRRLSAAYVGVETLEGLWVQPDFVCSLRHSPSPCRIVICQYVIVTPEWKESRHTTPHIFRYWWRI